MKPFDHKTALVFGVFDGVHEGHRALFAQAKSHADQLVVLVARDEICGILKGREPRNKEEARRSFVQAEPLVDRAILGDEELSIYKKVLEIRPDIACFGYDQEELKKDFVEWKGRHGFVCEIKTLEAHEPDVYHNSLLR